MRYRVIEAQRMTTPQLWTALNHRLAQLERAAKSFETFRAIEDEAFNCRTIALELQLRGVQGSLFD